MRRPQFVLGVAAALALPLLSRAQRTARLPKLGILYELPEPTAQEIAAGAVTRSLAELGWIEGKNLLVERRTSAGQRERLPGLQRNSTNLPLTPGVSAA